MLQSELRTEVRVVCVVVYHACPVKQRHESRDHNSRKRQEIVEYGHVEETRQLIEQVQTLVECVTPHESYFQRPVFSCLFI